MELPLYVWHDPTGLPTRVDAVVVVAPTASAVFNHTGTKSARDSTALAVVGATLAGTAGAGTDPTERWTRATAGQTGAKTTWTVRLGTEAPAAGRIELVDAGPPSGSDGSRLSLVAFYTTRGGGYTADTPPDSRLADINRPGRPGRDETQFPKLYQIDTAETRPYDGRRLAGTTVILGAVPVILGRLPGIPERLPSQWMNRWKIAAEKGAVSVSAAIEGGSTRRAGAGGGFPTGQGGGEPGEEQTHVPEWIKRLRKHASAVVRAPPGSKSLGSYVSDGVENRWALLARNIVAEPGKRVHGDCEDLAILAAAAISQAEQRSTQVGVAVVVVDKSGTRSPKELEDDRTEYRRGVDYRNHMAVVETRGRTVALADATAETITWKWPGILVAILDQSGIYWCREPGGRLGVSFAADGILDTANIVRVPMEGSLATRR